MFSRNSCLLVFFFSALLGLGLINPDTVMATSNSNGAPDRIIYVDIEATGIADGQSWADAYTDLQAALSQASGLAPAQNVQIWVADGVYYPIDNALARGEPSHVAFELINNVELYGGFAGGESALDERDWKANPTVLSGDIDGNDIVNEFGVSEHFDDLVGRNAVHVVRAFEVDTSARMDGLFITGGMADSSGFIGGTFLMRNGAGLHFIDSQVTLDRLQIQGNRALDGVSGNGGGAYFERTAFVAGTPALPMRDVHFINNIARLGGGLHIDSTETFIDGAVFEGNEAVSFGGAVYKVIVVVEMRNSLITGNRAANGGGLYGFRGFASIVNTRLSGNYATQNGGGFYFDQAPSIDMSVVLTNATLSGNRADGDGGGVYHEQPEVGTMLINNSILWRNEDVSGEGTAQANYGGPGAARFEATHSLIQGLDPAGEGNLDGTISASDPLFLVPVDPALAPTTLGDLRVAVDSPIIDRGTGEARVNPVLGSQSSPVPIEGEILVDLDGNDRITDGLGDGTPAIDLGPYESPMVERFTIGGEIIGLGGEGLVLELNANEALPIQDNGTFQFTTELLGGSEYLVTVANQPIRPPQLCTVDDASGTVDDDVAAVEVVCINRPDELFNDRFSLPGVR